MKAGKALNERKTEIRVQFKPPTAPIHGEAENMRNELVVGLLIALLHSLHAAPIFICSVTWIFVLGQTMSWVYMHEQTHTNFIGSHSTPL